MAKKNLAVIWQHFSYCETVISLFQNPSSKKIGYLWFFQQFWDQFSCNSQGFSKPVFVESKNIEKSSYLFMFQEETHLIDQKNEYPGLFSRVLKLPWLYEDLWYLCQICFETWLWSLIGDIFCLAYSISVST